MGRIELEHRVGSSQVQAQGRVRSLGKLGLEPSFFSTQNRERELGSDGRPLSGDASARGRAWKDRKGGTPLLVEQTSEEDLTSVHRSGLVEGGRGSSTRGASDKVTTLDQEAGLRIADKAPDKSPTKER